MKKKILIVVLTFLMIFNTCLYALAEDKSYEIKEAGITLSIPEEWVVFERIVDEFDENLELVNSSKEKLEEIFKERDIYLNAIMLPQNYEIVVNLNEFKGSQEIFDFNTFSEKELNILGKKLLEDNFPEETGVAYSGYEIYNHSQAKFIVFDIIKNVDGQEIYGKQYYTIINGQALYITLYSYIGEIEEDKANEINNIVNTIKFEEVKEKPKAGFFSQETFLNIGVKLVLGSIALLIFGSITLLVVWIKKRSSKKSDEEYFED